VETWDAIRSRRDVRAFAERPIGDDDLNRILEAGWRAPSSRNWQPWDFVVVTDRGQLAELATVWQGAGHVAGSAATVAIVAPVVEEARRQTEYFDLGQAAISMMIAAADLGIGSGHSAVGDHDLARRILGLPDDRICAHLVPLGYPAERPLVPLRRPDRRPFDEVVHRGRW
jgi:nitroreductase